MENNWRESLDHIRRVYSLEQCHPPLAPRPIRRRYSPPRLGFAMAAAMVMQMRRNAGFMFRESGQAMDRLGMSMMGDYSYMEPRE